MYGKFFSSTFTGSMFGAGSDVFAVWGYVVANAVDSTVELNPPLLAAILGTTTKAVQDAIEKLTSPDPGSRNPDLGGRRLVHDGGFSYRVTSHEIYRALRNEEDRRAYNREAQRKTRAKRSMSTGESLTQHGLSAPSAHTEAEAEYRDQKQETEPPSEGGSRGAGVAPPDGRFWTAGTWKTRFGLAWVVKYGRVHYGMTSDGKACGALSDLLAAMPETERMAAQESAGGMFAAFLASESPAVLKARHPFAFFVTEFGGLRVPQAKANGHGPDKPRDITKGWADPGKLGKVYPEGEQKI